MVALNVRIGYVTSLNRASDRTPGHQMCVQYVNKSVVTVNLVAFDANFIQDFNLPCKTSIVKKKKQGFASR
jgi:hypothetical protein